MCQISLILGAVAALLLIIVFMWILIHAAMIKSDFSRLEKAMIVAGSFIIIAALVAQIFIMVAEACI